MSNAQHHDLSAGPFRPSRVLVDFATARQAKRQADRVARERAAELTAFRRLGGSSGQPRRQAQQQVLAGLPQPAFSVVSGERAFSAATSGRLDAGWLVFNTGINADLEAALSTLRARSRDWFMNTDMGERYGTLVADNIVGSEPPRLQVRATLSDGKTMDEAANTAVEAAWAEWCRRGNCEVTGQLSFGEVLRNIAEGTAREGEYLARRIRDKRLVHGYALQLLDVDRIDTSMNFAPAMRGANAVRLGIEIDNLGRKVALWLYDMHPGDSGAGLAPKGTSGRVLAENLLHGFVLKRPEQARGYPWAAAVLKRANILDQYEQYAVVAAKIGAAKMGFYTVDKDMVEGGLSLEDLKDATGNLVQDVEAGMLEALPPGVDFKSFDPDYPHQNFGSFVDQCQRGLAAGLNVAHHNLSGNMAGVNYSSARIAELSERRHWRALQKWLVSSFVRPVFEDWLKMALLTQSIRLPSGAPLPNDRFDKFASAASFQPPGWAWVDPEGDIKAAAIAATYDMRSMRQITDEQGVDLAEVLADKKALHDQYVAAGLPVPGWMNGGAAMTVTGGQAPAPAPKPAPAPEPAA
jgi:lambda family phage portal protein